MTLVPFPVTPPARQFLKAWQEAIAGVLEQLAGAPCPVELAPESGLAGQFASLEPDGVWLRFVWSGKWPGEQLFLVSAAEAVRLAQLLMAEPTEPAELTPERVDAVEEVFRQFAGAAATALKSALAPGEEMAVQWAGRARPAWMEGSSVAAMLKLALPGGEGLLGLVVEEALAAALNPIPAAATVAPAGRIPESNLERLRNVELQVTLRFGERRLPLREILELIPGSVVELDRQIKEPVELMVSGKVIARGEVVIVDGNYGLRVTELAPPGQSEALP